MQFFSSTTWGSYELTFHVSINYYFCLSYTQLYCLLNIDFVEMAPPLPRRPWLKVFQNILRSLTPAYVRVSSEGGGKYIGADYLGNKYYEKPAGEKTYLLIQ